MKTFFEKQKPQNNGRALTKDEIDRQKGLEQMSPKNRSLILLALAERLLVDANNDIESVINGDESVWIMLSMNQREEVVRNMHQILNDQVARVVTQNGTGGS